MHSGCLVKCAFVLGGAGVLCRKLGPCFSGLAGEITSAERRLWGWGEPSRLDPRQALCEKWEAVSSVERRDSGTVVVGEPDEAKGGRH